MPFKHLQSAHSAGAAPCSGSDVRGSAAPCLIPLHHRTDDGQNGAVQDTIQLIRSNAQKPYKDVWHSPGTEDGAPLSYVDHSAGTKSDLIEKAPTIFHETWWLEAATAGRFKEVVTYDNNGAITGRLPYFRVRKPNGQSAIVMPTLTHMLGPVLADKLTETNTAHLTKRLLIIRNLIAQLPRSSHISFLLHGGVTDTLAFREMDFSTSVAFTVEIGPAPAALLWRQLRDKTRNVIRRAQENLAVLELHDVEAFMTFYEDNLRCRGLRNYYDPLYCKHVITESIRRGAGRILVAADRTGAYQSAIFTVWDRKMEYFLMSTRTATAGNGAVSLLIWTALTRAAEAGLTFDLDGIIPGSNTLLLTGFGGQVKPRYIVSKSTPIYAMSRYVRGLLRQGLATRVLRSKPRLPAFAAELQRSVPHVGTQ